VAGDGDLDRRITARGWLRRLRSRTVPPRAHRSADPHGQEPGGLRRGAARHLPCYAHAFSTRRSTSSQTPRQPYRGLHPTHQEQDSYTQSQSHNRHTTYGSNEESLSNSGGSPTMQAPPATRRPMSGQRWQHGTNAAQSNCFTSSAAPEARYHRAEVGRGMLMDGVALEQAPRVPTTEEDATRPDVGQS